MKKTVFLLTFALLISLFSFSVFADNGEEGAVPALTEGESVNGEEALICDGEPVGQNEASEGEGCILLFSTDSERVYMPTNLYIIGGTDNLVISWRNPQSEALLSVRFFDITEEEEEITEFNYYSASAKALAPQSLPQERYYPVNFKLSGLEAGEKKVYKIVCAFNGHKDTELIFETKVEATSLAGVASWGKEVHTGGNGYCPINPYIYTKDKRSGNSCLKIISNNQGVGNVFIDFAQAVPMSSDKNYRLSFWVKSNYGGISVFNNWDYGTYARYTNLTGELTDWVQKTTVFKNPSNTTLRMVCETQTDYFLIDDMELYELDEEGQPIGDNLIVNGGFEIDESACPKALANIKADTESVYEEVTLSWDKPQTEARVNIYYKDETENVLIRSIAGDENSVTLKGLMTDVETTLLLAAENASYLESEFTEITVTPVSYPLITAEIELYRGSTKRQTLIKGNLIAKTTVKNNRMGEDYSAELICVLYKDGKIEQIETSGIVNIPQTPSSEEPVEISVIAHIPTVNSGDYLEIFLWDSWEGMRVITPSVVFEKE